MNPYLVMHLKESDLFVLELLVNETVMVFMRENLLQNVRCDIRGRIGYNWSLYKKESISLTKVVG